MRTRTAPWDYKKKGSGSRLLPTGFEVDLPQEYEVNFRDRCLCIPGHTCKACRAAEKVMEYLSNLTEKEI